MIAGVQFVIAIYDQILDDVYGKIDQRLSTIGEGLDEKELTDAVAKNTDLNKQEADEAVKSITESYDQARGQAEKVLNDAKTQMEKLQAEAGKTIDDAKEATDEVMNEASKYTIYAFVASLLGMLLSVFAGRLGANKAQEIEKHVY